VTSLILKEATAEVGVAEPAGSASMVDNGSKEAVPVGGSGKSTLRGGLVNASGLSGTVGSLNTYAIELSGTIDDLSGTVGSSNTFAIEKRGIVDDFNTYAIDLSGTVDDLSGTVSSLNTYAIGLSGTVDD